ncbi:hypothetical protein B0H19DRAFT_1121771 [Mycena capillaripes]|nr:hypothetical protein B0H19DRAFT_1121771 [Mycena capillaripes]
MNRLSDPTFLRRTGCKTCAKMGGKLFQCSKCKRVCYCSTVCQAKPWPSHKLSCNRNGGDLNIPSHTLSSNNATADPVPTMSSF